MTNYSFDFFQPLENVKKKNILCPDKRNFKVCGFACGLEIFLSAIQDL
jgi:hypothetical protein